MPVSKPLNIQPKRILVITQRYLGDTLLITPLLSSLKQAYPEASLDVLIPQANLGILEGNPDIQQFWCFPAKGDFFGFCKLCWSLLRRYDLAISLQASDRTTLYAILAGKLSMGFIEHLPGKAWWKSLLLSRSLIYAETPTHTVLENLRFCELLAIQPIYQLTAPYTEQKLPSSPASPYVVLHIMPQWRFKQWHRQGWQELIEFLHQQQYEIVLTSSSQSAELNVLAELVAQYPYLINLGGQLSLAELAQLIAKADLFIGPDTGITHLAAATNSFTIAIFGPTDPKLWAPWPSGYACKTPPFNSQGTQRVNNVLLVQGESAQNCVPCQGEGCDRHRQSHSACLDQLSANSIISLIAASLPSANKIT